MKRLEKLLVYVDDLETLDGIIEMVAEIVSGTACRVVFASVVEPVPWGISQAAGIDADGWVAAQSKELEEGINDSVAALQQRGFDVQVKVYAGETTRTLVNAVIDDGFDVLIKAAGEDGGPLGRSNDQRILRHCPCPVAILRPPRADRSQIIMAAVEMNPDDPDDNEINDEIMDAAIRTAMGYFRQLVVVHAWHLHGESMLAHGIARLSTERLEQLRLGEQRRHQDWLQGY